MIEIKGLDQNPKLGFYKVGEKIFYSKPQAYIYATNVGIIPNWCFNVVDYAKLDWTIEPPIDIRELYRMRAQQLRDKYDYIRLQCSGGSDSVTAAFAFLLNGIHLDEITFRYPKLGEKGMVGDVRDTSAENTLSEWEFAAKPFLHWVKTNFPKTIVHVHDYTETMLENEHKRDESWVFQTRHWFQPAHGDKFNPFSLKEHRAQADSGKSICSLMGIDKPRITLLQNNWYSFFSDVVLATHPFVGDNTNITNELFFWTPDFPEIVIKQSHMIKRWLEMPQNHRFQNLVQPNFMRSHITAYEHLVRTIIYPDYDTLTWQTEKPRISFYNEMDHWFYTNFKDTKLYHTWEAGLQFLIDNIDLKYMIKQCNKPVGLVQNHSVLYHLGENASNMPQPPFTNRVGQPCGPTTVIQNKKIKRIDSR